MGKQSLSLSLIRVSRVGERTVRGIDIPGRQLRRAFPIFECSQVNGFAVVPARLVHSLPQARVEPRSSPDAVRVCFSAFITGLEALRLASESGVSKHGPHTFTRIHIAPVARNTTHTHAHTPTGQYSARGARWESTLRPGGLLFRTRQPYPLVLLEFAPPACHWTTRR